MGAQALCAAAAKGAVRFGFEPSASFNCRRPGKIGRPKSRLLTKEARGRTLGLADLGPLWEPRHWAGGRILDLGTEGLYGSPGTGPQPAACRIFFRGGLTSSPHPGTNSNSGFGDQQLCPRGQTGMNVLWSAACYQGREWGGGDNTSLSRAKTPEGRGRQVPGLGQAGRAFRRAGQLKMILLGGCRE